MLGIGMTYTDYNNLLYYDETSKSFLRWKTDRVGANGGVKIKANSEAGSLDQTTGYYRVSVQKKLAYAHRIIMILHGHCLKNLEVDHIDGNRINNVITNLRAVSHCENTRNRALSSNNTSGMHGVYFTSKFRKNGSTDNYWCGEWFDSTGKKHSKAFNIGTYGDNFAYQLAKQYRLDGIRFMNEELMNIDSKGYSDRHVIQQLINDCDPDNRVRKICWEL